MLIVFAYIRRSLFLSFDRRNYEKSLLFLLAVMLAVPGTVSAADQLPEGFIAISEFHMTWADAKAFCQQRGGRLPLIGGSASLASEPWPGQDTPIDGFGVSGAPWPGLPSGSYWTSTVIADRQGASWRVDDGCVDGGVGVVTGGLQSSLNRVVCVPADFTQAQDKNEQRLLGKRMFSLQWILFESNNKYGVANISRKDTGLCIDARHEFNGDYVVLKGDLTIISPSEFTVNGELVTRVSYINNGNECPRSGTFTFKATGKRKYWRMQEMVNPCDDAVDYVDVYF